MKTYKVNLKPAGQVSVDAHSTEINRGFLYFFIEGFVVRNVVAMFPMENVKYVVVS